MGNFAENLNLGKRVLPPLSLLISANTALSRDFGLRQITSVKCCPYIMLLNHGPGP